MNEERNEGPICHRFSMLFQNINEPFQKKNKKKSISSIIQPLYKYLPLLKIQHPTKNLETNLTFINKTHNSSKVYKDLQDKKMKFHETLNKLSLKNLCNVQKTQKTGNFEKIPKIEKKTTCFLDNLVFTNQILETQQKKTTFKELPARFLPTFYSKNLKLPNNHGLNQILNTDSSEVSKTFYIKQRKTLSQLLLKTEKSFESGNYINKFDQVSQIIVPTQTDEQHIENIQHVENIENTRNTVPTDDEAQQNLKQMEDALQLNSKKYLEVASDFKIHKHVTFEDIRKSLIDTLNIIFELKLNLEDVKKTLPDI